MKNGINLEELEKNLVAEIARLQSDLDAVRRTLQLAFRFSNKGMTPPPGAVESLTLENETPKAQVVKVEDAVREAVASFDGEFSTRSVEDYFAPKGIKMHISTIRSALADLAAKGALDVVVPGQGRRATVYKRRQVNT